MKKIIIINGAAQTGKDTVVNFSREILKNTNIGVFNFSSIDLVKNIASLMGWMGIKNEKSRFFLCELKKLWQNFNNKIFENLQMKIDSCPEYDSLIFIHMREPDEIELSKTYFENVNTLLIKRNNIQKFQNSADLNVNNYNYDFLLDNNQSLEILRVSVKTFLGYLLKDFLKNDNLIVKSEN